MHTHADNQRLCTFFLHKEQHFYAAPWRIVVFHAFCYRYDTNTWL
jgi:hypothetical protein